MKQTGKIAAQSSAGYAGYATADNSGVVTDKLDTMAQHFAAEPEVYVSIFDRIWLFGLSGDDTVRLIGFAVLILSGVAAFLNIRKSLRSA